MNLGYPVFIEAEDDGGGGDNWSHKIAQSSSQIIITNKPTPSFFTGQMPFLSPNQQCQNIEGKYITFHGLAYPKLTWGLSTLSLTINSSWLPWGGQDSQIGWYNTFFANSK